LSSFRLIDSYKPKTTARSSTRAHPTLAKGERAALEKGIEAEAFPFTAAALIFAFHTINQHLLCAHKQVTQHFDIRNCLFCQCLRSFTLEEEELEFDE